MCLCWHPSGIHLYVFPRLMFDHSLDVVFIKFKLNPAADLILCNDPFSSRSPSSSADLLEVPGLILALLASCWELLAPFWIVWDHFVTKILPEGACGSQGPVGDRRKRNYKSPQKNKRNKHHAHA